MKYKEIGVESSYRQNNLGLVLYEFVLEKKPYKIVEFGTLNGYSAIAMAMALHELGRGKLISYDLWDKYPYKHGSFNTVKSYIYSYGLQDFIKLRRKDLNIWLNRPERFDLLHIDISNTGDIINLVYQKLHTKVKKGASVLFEGGSGERDGVEWMIKHHKKPIADLGDRYEIIDGRFPSVSRLLLEQV